MYILFVYLLILFSNEDIFHKSSSKTQIVTTTQTFQIMAYCLFTCHFYMNLANFLECNEGILIAFPFQTLKK